MPARAALIALLTVVALGASPAAAQSDVSTSDASGGPAATASARRAVVIGTYAVLPTGRVHVSLASDAARVKLTYRNSDGRSRSRVVRIRGGKAAANLASGSRNLRARALATWRLGASGRVRLRRNPVLRDVDGNGIRESHYDLDTDGSYETVLFDDTACDSVLDGELVGSALHEGGAEQHRPSRAGSAGANRRDRAGARHGPRRTAVIPSARHAVSLPQRIPAELSL